MIEIIINSKTPLTKSRGDLEYDIEELIEGSGEWAGGGGGQRGWDIVLEIYDDAQAERWLRTLTTFLRKWGVPEDTFLEAWDGEERFGRRDVFPRDVTRHAPRAPKPCKRQRPGEAEPGAAPDRGGR
jgi:hypothetical protein